MCTKGTSTHALHRILAAFAVVAVVLTAAGCRPATSPSAPPAEKQVPPAASAAAYVISGVKIEKLPEVGIVKVTGKVTNTGEVTNKAVLLNATLYAKGVEIDVPADAVGVDTANNLKPGASQEFSVDFGSPDASQKALVSKLLAADEATVSPEIMPEL